MVAPAPEPLGPDLVEATCARCRTRLELGTVPREEFVCGRCGAVLAAVVVQVVHRISTTVRGIHTDYTDDDPTPVESRVPLPDPKG